MTVDPWVALFVGALGATVLTIGAGWLGERRESRREHARWVREQRIAAYREFISVAEQPWPSQSPDRDVWRAHMDLVMSALGVVTIIGPESVTTAAADHYDASMDFASVQRKVNGSDGSAPRPELRPDMIKQAARVNATRAAFVAAAQSVLGIEN